MFYNDRVNIAFYIPVYSKLNIQLQSNNFEYPILNIRLLKLKFRYLKTI